MLHVYLNTIFYLPIKYFFEIKAQNRLLKLYTVLGINGGLFQSFLWQPFSDPGMKLAGSSIS